MVSVKRKQSKADTGYARRPWLKLVERPVVTEDPRARLFFPKASKRSVLELEGNQIDSSPVEMGLDQAATVTFSVTDPAGDLASLGLLDVDEDMLLDGIDVRWARIWWRIARIERTDSGWRLTCEDRVAAYLRSKRHTVVASRATVTRAEFVQRLVASVRAGGGITIYIPELRDKQKIAPADVPPQSETTSRTVKKARTASGSGWGAAASKVRMKGRKLSASQLKVLDEGLSEAARLGASKRVMMAVEMAMTQESELGDLRTSVSGRHKGVLHQEVGRGWARTAQSANDVTASVRRFLTGGDLGAPGWKQKHGSVKSASGNLGAMIDAVQVAGTPGAFGQHEAEAKRNVELWLDRNSAGGGTSGGSSSDSASETYYRARYAFRTGDKSNPSDWWDATGQLAEEVKWHRWAVNNTFGYASDDELVRGTPTLFVSRDRPEIHAMDWSWDYRREASELTVTVALESTFALLPGMVAMVDDEAPISGRWLVDTISVDPLANNIATVQLRRRGAKALEPAPEIKARDSGGVTVGGKQSYRSGAEEGASAGQLSGSDVVAKTYRAAVAISSVTPGYLYGGGHGPKVSSLRGSQKLDCSSSSSLALWKAGAFPFSTAIVSGQFASSWGKPGRGKQMTVWANAEHVWIEFHDVGMFSRFDTSPHGDGGPGPRMRKKKRTDQGAFTARHWPGT